MEELEFRLEFFHFLYDGEGRYKAYIIVGIGSILCFMGKENGVASLATGFFGVWYGVGFLLGR
ncbi:hypothetical protein [Neobacillus niacini]|uniref:hypothetical protein n=1 Tax=Neobacillus niacini TaxID=86668 RepID=UPI0039836749